MNEIDTDELQEFLNDAAGPCQWLVMSEWLFSAPVQIFRPGLILVPVLTPSTAAQRLRLSECEDRQPRLFGEHAVDAQELSNWRWLAAQVYPRVDGRGVFPWEHDEEAALVA